MSGSLTFESEASKSLGRRSKVLFRPPTRFCPAFEKATVSESPDDEGRSTDVPTGFDASLSFFEAAGMNTVLNLLPLSNDTTVTGPAPFPFLPFFFLPSSSPQPLKSGAGKESSTKSPPGASPVGIPGSCFAVSIGFGPAGLSGALSCGLGPTKSGGDSSDSFPFSLPVLTHAAPSSAVLPCQLSKLIFKASAVLRLNVSDSVHFFAMVSTALKTQSTIPLMKSAAHLNFPQIQSHALPKYGPTTSQFSISQ